MAIVLRPTRNCVLEFCMTCFAAGNKIMLFLMQTAGDLSSLWEK
jgi:hypothetical protein